MKLIKNTFLLTFSFILSRGLAIVWNLYLARLFATKLDELSVYLFIITQFGIFSILAEGNITYAIQHFISNDSNEQRESDKNYWAFSFYSRVILGLLFGLILYFIVIFQYPNSGSNAFLISLTLLVFNIGSAPMGILIANNEFKLQTYSYLINSIVFTIGAIFIISITSDIKYILFILLLANVISSIYSLYHGFRLYGIPKLASHLKSVSLKIFRFSLPLVVASFCFVFFYRMDVNIIANSILPKDVTYVSMALMFYFLIVDLLWSQLASAMTPTLLRKWNDGQESRNYVIERFINLLSIYSILTSIMCVGLVLFGKILFYFFLGESGSFENIVDILFYLLLGLPFLVGYAFLHRIFLIKNTSVTFMIYSSSILFFKFIIVFLFHDFFSALSLAILSSFLIMIVYILFIFFMNDLRIFKRVFLSNFLKLAFINALLVSFIIFSQIDITLINKIICGLIICLTTLLIFRKVLFNELGRLRFFLKKSSLKKQNIEIL